MGCYHGTCGVTQLAIRRGDPVALFPLVGLTAKTRADGRYAQTGMHAGHVHSNYLWSPATLPIYGIYNDYGSIKEIEESWRTADIVARFCHAMRPEDRQKIVDLPSFLAMLQRTDIVLAYGKMFSNDVGFMMVHRFVYEHLATYVDPHDMLRPYGNAEIMQSGRAFYEAMREHAKALDDGGTQLPIFGVRKIPFPAKPDNWIPFRNPFCSLFSEERDDTSAALSVISLNDYRRILTEFAIKQTPVTDAMVDDILNELTRLWRFDRNFQLLRKTYMPQAGAGSQNDNARLFRHINFFLCNELLARSMKDDEEDWS